jgi:ABC-2 type transport system ATP-binding protein
MFNLSLPVLKLDGIRKFYGRQPALNDVSFQIEAGQYVGLLGPNGAGKSTLFQIISGLFAPDAGSVRLFGMDYLQKSSDILRRVGVVFQVRSVDLDMSVRSNLRFHGHLFGLSGSVLGNRISELADQFGFADQLSRQVRTLSGGQQRRIEIARALLNRPDLILMDEPSAGLDTSSRRELVAHVRALARDQGVAVLWATHLVDEVEEADRIVLLMRGSILVDGSPQALMKRAGAKSLTDAYVSMTEVVDEA